MIGLKTVDSIRQEEAEQGYVDFHEDDDGSEACVNDSETGFLTG